MNDPLQSVLKIGASGLQAQSVRMRVLAENVANAQSTGATPGSDPYTRKQVTFENQLDDVEAGAGVKVTGVETVRSAYRIEHIPGHPAADAKGFVKLPNVDIMSEVSDMREANRSYDASLQMIKQARDMINTAIDMLRSS